MPVYNGERFLAEAIESVLNQSYPYLELLVLDNGSSDRTAQIVTSYAQKDSRVRPLYEPEPFGYGGELASNVAARHAKGTFIAKLDADDLAKSDRFAKQVAFLTENPDIFLVGSNVELINERGLVTGQRKYPTAHQAIRDEFYLRFPIANPSIMYRNALTDDLYKIRFPHFNDYYSLFLLMHQEKKRFYNLSESLTAYRIHTRNTVFTNLRVKWKSNMAIKRAFVEEFGYAAPWKHRTKVAAITLFINSLPERFLIAIMNQTRRIINA